MSDLDSLTVGLVTDIFIEKNNDTGNEEEDTVRMASQEDYDRW